MFGMFQSEIRVEPAAQTTDGTVSPGLKGRRQVIFVTEIPVCINDAFSSHAGVTELHGVSYMLCWGIFIQQHEILLRANGSFYPHDSDHDGL